MFFKCKALAHENSSVAPRVYVSVSSSPLCGKGVDSAFVRTAVFQPSFLGRKCDRLKFIGFVVAMLSFGNPSVGIFYSVSALDVRKICLQSAQTIMWCDASLRIYGCESHW